MRGAVVVVLVMGMVVLVVGVMGVVMGVVPMVAIRTMDVLVVIVIVSGMNFPGRKRVFEQDPVRFRQRELGRSEQTALEARTNLGLVHGPAEKHDLLTLVAEGFVPVTHDLAVQLFVFGPFRRGRVDPPGSLRVYLASVACL